MGRTGCWTAGWASSSTGLVAGPQGWPCWAVGTGQWRGLGELGRWIRTALLDVSGGPAEELGWGSAELGRSDARLGGVLRWAGRSCAGLDAVGFDCTGAAGTGLEVAGWLDAALVAMTEMGCCWTGLRWAAGLGRRTGLCTEPLLD
ncbi:UNVERIFIED_CONTAM: hypothetical protein Sradi_5045400 [Sesamum radiatum]|uniref:Uncharacterized protein n=1 Tax=Sesamum radiatum TaxID=300843 RepID=A0AAW2M3Z0_SESRA